MHTKCWSENLKGKDHTGNVGVDGKIILKWTFETQGIKAWTGLKWLRIGPKQGLLLQLDELLGSQKEAFLDQLRTYKLFNQDPEP
jgi:hypothetical protein